MASASMIPPHVMSTPPTTASVGPSSSARARPVTTQTPPTRSNIEPSETSVAQRAAQIAHVVLRLFEQGPQCFGHVREAQLLRLLEALPVRRQLAFLELEIDCERPARLGLVRHLGHVRGRLASQDGELL